MIRRHTSRGRFARGRVSKGFHLAARRTSWSRARAGGPAEARGGRDAALACYQKANVPGKVIEGLAAKGDFEALSKFTAAQARAARLQPLAPCISRRFAPFQFKSWEGLGRLV